MAADEKKTLIRDKYIELQIIQQQAEELQKQIAAVKEQIAEISSVKQSLSELSSCRPGSSMLVPISSGVFAKAELKSNEELAVNVGGNTVVVKSVDATKALLERQIGEVRSVEEQLEANLRKFGLKAQELTVELKKLVE